MLFICTTCCRPGYLAQNCPNHTSIYVVRSAAQGHSMRNVLLTSCLEAKETNHPRSWLKKSSSPCWFNTGYKRETNDRCCKPLWCYCVHCWAIATTRQGLTTRPLLYCDLEIEGVPVNFMVDCRSQMTIISRFLPHQVFMIKSLCWSLRMSTIQLYSKDCPAGKRQLPITAEMDLSLIQSGWPVFICLKHAHVPFQ